MINNDKKVSLYRRMLQIRLAEETIAERYKEQKMRCPVHLSIGQEAVAAGVGELLTREDLAVSGHRAHAHYLGKGGNLKAMMAEIYGKATGCSGGNGGSMHLIDESAGFKGSTAIVGGTIPVGVGLGLSLKLNKSKNLSCVFLGDGAVEEGAFYEAANFAALKNLPVLFACENNFYSVYSHINVRQPKGREIFEMVEGIGIPSQKVDGNDILSVYNETGKAVEKIRAGEGPQFIEYTTYRWREHCGPNFDNDIGYRSEEEYQQWKEKDPVSNYEKHLLAESVLDDSQIKQIGEEIQTEVNEAFEFAEKSDWPAEDSIFQNLYSNSGRTHA